MTQIIPAIIPETTDDLKLIDLVEEYVDWIHIDIMDGIFVDSKTINDQSILKSLNTKLNIELHLMVSEPEKWIGRWQGTKVKHCICHREALFDPKKIIDKAKRNNLQISFALNPETNSNSVYDFIDSLDSILVMTVFPGKGGQKFLPEVLPKIKDLRQKFPKANIAADGGIDDVTIRLAKEAGANIFVVGSYIFNKREGIKSQIQKLCTIL